MFESLGSRSRKRRRRKSMRTNRGRGRRGISRRGTTNLGPILKIAGLVVAVAGLACLIIFVIVPLFGGDKPDETAEATPTEQSTPSSTPEPTPIARADMSGDVAELVIDYKSVNDPIVSGTEMVFSTGNPMQTSPEIDKVVLYDMNTGQTSEIADITRRYISLFEPKINDNFIVYLDCKSQFGGAVTGYDRASGETFVMREYLYGKPKVALVGDYALWMQQTRKGSDKLYLYHLPSKESTTIEEFRNTPFSIAAAHMDSEALVYVQPFGESNLLEGSSASMEAEIVVMPLSDGGDKQLTLFRPGMFVYDPMISGDHIVFIDRPRDENSRLMVCERSADTYTTPEVIAEGIMNFKVGDGYVVYTKDDAVFIYYFADGSSGQLSSSTTRAILSSANGKDVVWYDTTDGLDASANVIMHITVP